jgi:hypothetical protein
MKYYIKDDFYFDIDKKNQLRITGPENHLFLGLTFPHDLGVKIDNYEIEGRQLEVKLKLDTDKLETSIPLVTDIRTLRNHTEGKSPSLSYSQLVDENVSEVIPKSRQSLTERGNHLLVFEKTYIDVDGKTRSYGVRLVIPKRFTVNLRDKTFTVQGKKPVVIKVRTTSNIYTRKRFPDGIINTSSPLPEKLFSPLLLDIYTESEKNISYLIRTKKTSSFEYGTIFPRDWIESADLGEGDLSELTVDHMYEQSLRYVSETGEGWHEEAVGEYRTRIKDRKRFVDRKMIDIEPHYIMGLERVSKNFLIKRENQKKLRLVAEFIIRNARENSLLTFKRLDNGNGEYLHVGNWRDSSEAFPKHESPLAPYDVNCVFYPTSLRIIKKYNQFFRIKNLSELDELIEKWDQNKSKFRLYHANDTLGYSLALHGKKKTPLPIAHLDESYDLFYGLPSMEETVSFTQKIIDPGFFFTPVGPLIIDINEENLTSLNYHGKVIWPKQSAFSVAGLVRQYRKGLKEEWPKPVLDSIRNAVIVTCRTCFKGWLDLGVVPELYYYDVDVDKARFFTDQEGHKGQMSLVQLWSLVGARRIMREYAYIMTGEEI